MQNIKRNVNLKMQGNKTYNHPYVIPYYLFKKYPFMSMSDME